jgi:hypothetical protein
MLCRTFVGKYQRVIQTYECTCSRPLKHQERLEQNSRLGANQGTCFCVEFIASLTITRSVRLSSNRVFIWHVTFRSNLQHCHFLGGLYCVVIEFVPEMTLEGNYAD